MDIVLVKYLSKAVVEAMKFIHVFSQQIFINCLYDDRYWCRCWADIHTLRSLEGSGVHRKQGLQHRGIDTPSRRQGQVLESTLEQHLTVSWAYGSFFFMKKCIKLRSEGSAGILKVRNLRRSS